MWNNFSSSISLLSGFHSPQMNLVIEMTIMIYITFVSRQGLKQGEPTLPSKKLFKNRLRFPISSCLNNLRCKTQIITFHINVLLLMKPLISNLRHVVSCPKRYKIEFCRHYAINKVFITFFVALELLIRILRTRICFVFFFIFILSYP